MPREMGTLRGRRADVKRELSDSGGGVKSAPEGGRWTQADEDREMPHTGRPCKGEDHRLICISLITPQNAAKYCGTHRNT